uniref:Uncharacterized protein n=1 Tax=Chromera velia CCMP2878 TaxID=1169474 RepID=A0A0G4HF59_9ALVE|eukprot:Cvel_26855.t1-p1 / transcript=Cvel_26855.t1 / gene=Cvel_26855 / organism=Chromera_velia_CCMP2878 / gene_product=hypothetical protein / transcript_product=hypothetical protein / location=Cvel_scaffold3257:9055-11558(-) / protein_length=73 / sequence_SO=supercontig / SO=protein_coding / is_pseudo=false
MAGWKFRAAAAVDALRAAAGNCAAAAAMVSASARVWEHSEPIGELGWESSSYIAMSKSTGSVWRHSTIRETSS